MQFKPSPGLASSLSELLVSLSRAGVGQAAPEQSKASPPDSTRLSNWLTSIAEPLQAARASAWNFDPWEVVGLGRDEMRNSRILAWLLNPMGSHGFGDAQVRSLLAHVGHHLQGFPDSAGGHCSVRTEQCPNGDFSERVDIEIDAASFYLLIEVKIDATEGVDQLSRYGKLAQAVAGNRPWAIIYLTPGKKEAQTGGEFSRHIVTMSWKEMARTIEKTIPKSTGAHASSQHAASHAATSFLKHVRNH